MLNSIYDSDANGLDRRNTGTRDCSAFNKDNGYSQESALVIKLLKITSKV